MCDEASDGLSVTSSGKKGGAKLETAFNAVSVESEVWGNCGGCGSKG